MPPHPKRKLSKARRDRRRAHDSLTPANLVKCKRCGAMHVSHRMCPECGTYDGQTIVEMEAEKK
jgi:large subunit ribosomal protein L32